eukprot:SAG31_NODE_164_length_21790_cov_26.291411_14_plen_82_part_00
MYIYLGNKFSTYPVLVPVRSYRQVFITLPVYIGCLGTRIISFRICTAVFLQLYGRTSSRIHIVSVGSGPTSSTVLNLVDRY